MRRKMLKGYRTLRIEIARNWESDLGYKMEKKLLGTEKPVRTFRQMEQYSSRVLSFVWKKTVVPLGNQMEQFFPLAILGNKPRISPRGMVRKCDEANDSMVFQSLR